jgi:predicted nucleotidyltransferase
MKQTEILSYTYDFLSQLYDDPISSSINRIILFGSVARNDFTPESDIDLFVDVIHSEKKVENVVRKQMNKFEARAVKIWHLRDIDNPIKVLVGNLKDKRWDQLRNEIISYGKILFGKFEELPQTSMHHVIITYDLHKLSQKKKMALLRALFGYTSIKKKKRYTQSGILERHEGKKIGANAVIIPVAGLLPIKKTFKKYNVKHRLIECWTK